MEHKAGTSITATCRWDASEAEKIPCSYCQVGPGPCVTRSGKERKPHTDRMVAAFLLGEVS